MSSDPRDPMDASLRRFLEWEVRQIDGAPDEAQMVARLSGPSGARGRLRGWALPSAPAFRMLVLIAVVGALITGSFAAGSWWSQQHATILRSSDATRAPDPTAPPIPDGALAAGTYLVTANSANSYTVTVPGGWTYNHTGFIAKGDYQEGNGVAMTTWIVTDIYADSCRWRGTLEKVGSPESLAAALARQLGHATSDPTASNVGGVRATTLRLSVAADFDVSRCDSSMLRLWPDPGANESGGEPTYPGQTTNVYVLDIRATVLLTVAREGASSADLAELAAILDSVRFQGLDVTSPAPN